MDSVVATKDNFGLNSTNLKWLKSMPVTYVYVIWQTTTDQVWTMASWLAIVRS